MTLGLSVSLTDIRPPQQGPYPICHSNNLLQAPQLCTQTDKYFNILEEEKQTSLKYLHQELGEVAEVGAAEIISEKENPFVLFHCLGQQHPGTFPGHVD